MTAPTIEPRGRGQVEQSRPKRLTTGVLVDCPCGATAVPMAWSGAGKNDTVRLYWHVPGKPYGGKGARRGDKCGGPKDLFSFMLRESKLMMGDFRRRVTTRAEQAEFDRRAEVAEVSEHGPVQGVLF